MRSARRISSPSYTRSGNCPSCYQHNTRLLAGVVLLTLLLCGCAGMPQDPPLPDTQVANLPPAHELTGVPFFPQDRYQCGPAALATVLANHGIDIKPDELVDQVYLPARQASLPEELASAARRYGMLTYPLTPDLADLLTEVAKGHPVLVFQNLGLSWVPRHHFAVVIGYDLVAGEVLLRSGTTQRRRTALATFERTWARNGRRAWVILPAGEIPATANVQSYLQAAHALEQSDRPEAARAAWRAAVHTWPRNAKAWMALGNSHYNAQAYHQAGTAFQQAIRLAPQAPEGWNNLAYALLRQHCPQQARLAAQCAAQLGPQEVQFSETVAEIDRLASGRDAPHCAALACPTGQPQAACQDAMACTSSD